MNIGADGLKTGFVKEAGYGIVGSAVQDGLRLIVVVNGTKSEKERSDEARKLLGQFHPAIVNGEERQGEGSYELRSPIDDEIVLGSFAQATVQDEKPNPLKKALDEKILPEGKTTP